MTFWIWMANSRVGDKTKAWVSLFLVSILCKTPMLNVAVLPVPDWALKSSTVSGYSEIYEESQLTGQ